MQDDDPPLIAPNAAVDYDAGWGRWGDMIRFSPAPWHRRRLLLAEARRLRFDSVLDVGCGRGEMLQAFGERFPARGTGVDLSEAAVAACRRRFPDARFEVLDLEADRLSERFDLVLCSEVLEHCGDPARALGNLRQMTAGHLLLTVPGGPVFPIDRAMGHHRHFRPDSLRGLLAENGFDVLRVRRWGFPFHSAYKLAINLRPRAALESFAGGAYGPAQRAIGTALRGLFHLNLLPFGWQLVAAARPR